MCGELTNQCTSLVKPHQIWGKKPTWATSEGEISTTNKIFEEQKNVSFKIDRKTFNKFHNFTYKGPDRAKPCFLTQYVYKIMITSYFKN